MSISSHSTINLPTHSSKSSISATLPSTGSGSTSISTFSSSSSLFRFYLSCDVDLPIDIKICSLEGKYCHKDVQQLLPRCETSISSVFTSIYHKNEHHEKKDRSSSSSKQIHSQVRSSHSSTSGGKGFVHLTSNEIATQSNKSFFSSDNSYSKPTSSSNTSPICTPPQSNTNSNPYIKKTAGNLDTSPASPCTTEVSVDDRTYSPSSVLSPSPCDKLHHEDSRINKSLDRAESGPADLYITCKLMYLDERKRPKDLYPFELTSSFHPFSSSCRLDEWMNLPLRYYDLPFDSFLQFSVLDISSPGKTVVIGTAKLNMFQQQDKTLVQGWHRLAVSSEDSQIKQRCPFHTELSSFNPSWVSGAFLSTNKSPSFAQSSLCGDPISLKEFDRLEVELKRYGKGEVEHVDWLDVHAFEAINDINNNFKKDFCGLFLYIELPEFNFPVIYHEKISKAAISVEERKSNMIIRVVDPEWDMVNPVEHKYLKLARSNRRATNILDFDLKPDSRELKRISAIIEYPPSKHLSFEDKEIFWKFMRYLSKNKKAMTKFLTCVDWDDPQEVRHALAMMERWEPIDIADSLFLLSYAFPHQQVRKYAVERLKTADDEELLHYLLQLVQAMQYEKDSSDRPLSNFLLERSQKNIHIFCSLFWYLTAEVEENEFFAHQRARLLNEINKDFTEMSRRQMVLVKRLISLQKTLKGMNISRPKKIERMKQMLTSRASDEQFNFSDLQSFQELPWLMDVNIHVTGIIPEKCHIYKSALAPLGVVLRTSEDKEYHILFKEGDDLRQDQLIIHMILLMDRLLKKENLDLKLVPYKVLATSCNNGMVEFIQSKSLATIIKEYDGNIHKYLREYHFSATAPYNIQPKILDTFVKSCAGYSVITHILGIGDRHLDNLLLTPTGNLFHVDFGFILGKDPKPFPAPMRICKEMVEAMGGENSKHYLLFKQYCCEAYNILRKSATLILNLFALMADSNIPGLASEREKSILKLQEKFRLELTDEQASQTMLLLINESSTALAPIIVENVHRAMQYMRS